MVAAAKDSGVFVQKYSMGKSSGYIYDALDLPTSLSQKIRQP